MAEEKIGVEIEVDIDQAGQSISSLKKEFKELQKQLDGARIGSEEYQKTLVKLGDTRHRIQKLNENINAFAGGGGQLKAVQNAVGGIAAGFQAATAATALFGSESEELTRTLVKVQAAMAFTQAIKEIEGMKDSFIILNQVIKANPIMAIVSAVIALGAAVGVVYNKWFSAEAVAKEHLETTKTLYDVEVKESELLDAKTNQLKLQGYSEEQILELKKKQTGEQILAMEAQILAQKNIQQIQIETAERNAAILDGILKFTFAPLQAIADTVDYISEKFGKELGLGDKVTGMRKSLTSLIFDPEKVKKEGEDTISEMGKQLNALLEKRAGFELSINEIHRKASEERKKILQDEMDFRLKMQEDYEKQSMEIQKEWDEKKKLQMIEDANKRSQLQNTIQETTATSTVNYEKDKASAIESIQRDTFSVIADLGNTLIKEQEKAQKFGKAVILAQLLADTASAIGSLTKASAKTEATIPAPAGTILAIAQYASGIARITSNIAKAKQILSSSNTSSGATSGLTGVSASAPQLPNITSTLINPDGTVNIPQSQQPSQPVKVFVTETDITNTQNRIKSINNKARIV